jgi:hypothetical protein
MAPFLSADWIAQLATAARSDERLRAAAEGVTLTIQQFVDADADEAAAWYVRFSDGEVDIVPGVAHEVDVVIHENRATATRVSRGELSPAEAFSSGNMRIGGQIGLLVHHQALLAHLRDTLATVYAGTTYTGA